MQASVHHATVLTPAQECGTCCAGALHVEDTEDHQAYGRWTGYAGHGRMTGVKAALSSMAVAGRKEVSQLLQCQGLAIPSVMGAVWAICPQCKFELSSPQLQVNLRLAVHAIPPVRRTFSIRPHRDTGLRKRFAGLVISVALAFRNCCLRLPDANLLPSMCFGHLLQRFGDLDRVEIWIR